jgi:5'-deoxynucleotidase YfbR-like HD superfamily hydrolase
MNETVRRIVGPTILLFGGSYFDYEAPESSEFTIEDIAHGLSMTCRFAGHCGWHYSVAQHSVHVSNFVPKQFAYEGLMHDAPEFAVGDMAKPLKVMCPDYTVIERRVEVAVFKRFNVRSPLPVSVKEVDIRMLATEQRQLMKNRDDWDYTRGRAPYDFQIPVWSPAEAKQQFLARFTELSSSLASQHQQDVEG